MNGGWKIPRFTLGDRLRKAREVTGMKQVEFAEHIGMNRGSIGNFETGKQKPSDVVISAWAMATGVDRRWLQYGAERIEHHVSTAPEQGKLMPTNNEDEGED